MASMAEPGQVIDSVKKFKMGGRVKGTCDFKPMHDCKAWFSYCGHLRRKPLDHGDADLTLTGRGQSRQPLPIFCTRDRPHADISPELPGG